MEKVDLLQELSIENLRILEDALKKLYQRVINDESPFMPVLYI